MVAAWHTLGVIEMCWGGDQEVTGLCTWDACLTGGVLPGIPGITQSSQCHRP